MAKLTEKQKDQIADAFDQGKYNQTELAAKYQVHRKTIYRVLMEKGSIGAPHETPQQREIPVHQRKPLSQVSALPERVQSIMAVVDHHGLTAEQLHVALNSPSLTPSNVKAYLGSLSREELSSLFFDMAMVHGLKQIQALSAQQASGKPPEGAVLQ